MTRLGAGVVETCHDTSGSNVETRHGASGSDGINILNFDSKPDL
ncbi:MAG: hypothetical protein RIM23_23110 [Coleofasciculus sp. G3-WIS-01]